MLRVLTHLLACFLLSPLALTLPLHAQNTAFTYQGRLADGGKPATGNYDLQFSLTDAEGKRVCGVLTNAPVAVSNGLFLAVLDFGSAAFDGSPRWLEIGVRTNGSAEAYTLLSPRQAITAEPYATFANTAAKAAVATTLAPGATITGDGSGITNLGGTSIRPGTINSNALDEPTLARLALAGSAPNALANTNGTGFGTYRFYGGPYLTNYFDINSLNTHGEPWTGSEVPNVGIDFGPWSEGFGYIAFRQEDNQHAEIVFWPNHIASKPLLMLQSSGNIDLIAQQIQSGVASSWTEQILQYSEWALNMFNNDPDIFPGATALTFSAVVCTNGDDLVWAGSRSYVGSYSAGQSINATFPRKSYPGLHFQPTKDKSGDGELVFWSQLANNNGSGPWIGTNKVVSFRAGGQRGVDVFGHLTLDGADVLKTNSTLNGAMVQAGTISSNQLDQKLLGLLPTQSGAFSGTVGLTSNGVPFTLHITNGLIYTVTHP